VPQLSTKSSWGTTTCTPKRLMVSGDAKAAFGASSGGSAGAER